MGSVFRQKGRNRQTWMMKYYVNGRPIVESSGTTSKMKAQRRCDDLETDLRRGLPITPDANNEQSSVDENHLAPMDLSRRRLSEMFLVLKAVRRIVDETHDLAVRALQDAADDRARLDDWRDGEPAARAFCRRLVSERETLAREIESIRFALDNLYILPRTRNLGRKARGAKKTLP